MSARDIFVAAAKAMPGWFLNLRTNERLLIVDVAHRMMAGERFLLGESLAGARYDWRSVLQAHLSILVSRYGVPEGIGPLQGLLWFDNSYFEPEPEDDSWLPDAEPSVREMDIDVPEIEETHDE